ncbi:MAG: IPT/TIG domain-containing protein, partial [Candidatus Manganitrophaceae bacterium]
MTQATVATLPTDRGPRDVALHPSTKKLIVTNFRADTLSVIDFPNRTLLAMVPVGKGPAAVAIDPGLNLAAVANARAGSISLIDLATHAVVGTIVVGGRPVDIDIDPERHLAVVADEKRDQALIIDLSTRMIAATIAVGKDPVSVAVNPNTHIAAIANRKSNSLSILDLTTRGVTATVGPLPTPTGVAIDRSTNIAAVVSHRLNTLILVDLATNMITTSFTVGPQPEQVAIHPYMNVAVVTHREGVTITPLPNPVPELTALIPDAAGVGESGLTVTLTGKKFVRSATVRFGSQTFPSRFVNNEELKVDLPPQALAQTGFVEVSVVHPSPGGGVSNSLTFTIRNPAPLLTSLSPASAPAGSGGVTLTLSGANFLPTSQIFFNNQPISTTFIGATQLTASLPAAMLATPGVYPVRVTHPPPGGGTSNPLDFQVIGPVIQTISPARGPAGTVVTIRGLNFDPAAGNDRVKFNGKEAIVAAANGTEIVTAVPQGAMTGPVTVTTPIGAATGPAPFEVISSSDFSLSAAPATLSLPQGGSAVAQLSVTSTGGGLFT